ncbi:thioredoxin-disulfide reductase [Velocimicrobium porci]|uniref:Thioredoxin reductase n=1 Tax=Velocimicrobium porci TaxID=2606634 RepID=A0A6L5Y065_9FIRM|nr:thioredoxin-disulfide reductase [Velocimicrobium porci]MSS64227.1 thioredoxin-disulfide reductase [Velocimicrobium porci]
MGILYDTIIIGAGPAGLAAGIYAKRAELKSIIIEKAPMSGGQIVNTYEVDNYPGLPGMSGFELANRFRTHCDKLNVEFVEGEVAGIKADGKNKVVTLENGEAFTAKTIIIAGGAVHRKLGVEGEEKLTGMGVSYCATCDGAFFRNAEVAVVGGGDVAIEDAIFLARIAKKVYVIHRRDEFRAAKSLVSTLLSMDNVEILRNSVVEKIVGEDVVEKIKIRDIETKTERELPVEGVFVAVGTEPITAIYDGMIEMDEKGYIVADEDCATNVPGIFVAGDIRTKPLRQVVTAASDGANAITAVEQFLAKCESH